MVAPVKALLAVGILGAGATGGTFLFKGLGPGMPVYKKLPDQPTWKPVWKDKDFSTVYAENSFGKDYQDLFVGTEESSKAWWDDAYDRFQKDKSHSTEFKGQDGITSAFSTKDGVRALNQVCKSFYKQDADTVEGRSKTLTGHFRFQESKVDKDVWKYCSPLGENPISPDIFLHRGKYSEVNPGDLIYLSPGTLGQLFWGGEEVAAYKGPLSIAFRRRMAIMLDKAWGLNEYQKVGPAAKSKRFLGSTWPQNLKNKIIEERNKGIYYDIDIIDEYCKHLEHYPKTVDDFNELKEDVYKFCTLKGKVDNTHNKHYLSIEDSIETLYANHKNKWGDGHGFVALYSLIPSSKEVKNKDWWEETFKNLKNDQTNNNSSLLPVLQTVDKAWPDKKEDTKALNQACNSLLQDTLHNEDNKVKRILGKEHEFPTRKFQKDKADWGKYKSNLEKYCTFKMTAREKILFDKWFS